MRILLATDGGKQSDAAIDALRSFAWRQGDEVRVVSVVDMALPMAIDIYGGFLPDTAELESRARENGAKIAEETAQKIAGFVDGNLVTISTEVLFGSPDSRIVEEAESWGATLIVVGSHGYSRWERLLLGSVSDSVLHHAPCSVLVVRTPTTS